MAPCTAIASNISTDASNGIVELVLYATLSCCSSIASVQLFELSAIAYVSRYFGTLPRRSIDSSFKFGTNTPLAAGLPRERFSPMALFGPERPGDHVRVLRAKRLRSFVPGLLSL